MINIILIDIYLCIKRFCMSVSTKRSPAQKAAWRKLPKWLKAKIRENPLVKWAQRCKREFEYRCVMCHTSNNLEAHHIFFKSEYPHLKEDLDNSCCLCRECHDKMHTLFISNSDDYYIQINTFLELRKPIKRIKKRNPSGYTYFLSKPGEPYKFPIEKIKPSSQDKKNKNRKPNKNKQK